MKKLKCIKCNCIIEINEKWIKGEDYIQCPNCGEIGENEFK